MKKLYLDDDRIPRSDGWDIVRNFEDFKNWIELNGLPYTISFDHDLGSDNGILRKNGVDCARWLCNYCISNGLPLPEWNIHSANYGGGRENIESILKTYEKIFNYN